MYRRGDACQLGHWPIRQHAPHWPIVVLALATISPDVSAWQRMGVSRSDGRSGLRHGAPASPPHPARNDLCARGDGGAPRPDRAHQPAGQRDRHAAAERALDGAGGGRGSCRRRGGSGPLHGLPIAHKDLVPTKGIRTTYGSPIYRDYVPDADALIVERLQAAGAITIGKTNTPEFGAGSQTFNAVFGATRNPYDLTKTAAAAAAARPSRSPCGMIPIADGSDIGGSLRNPAGFCNVVGFRPSPGRVPT